MAHSDAQVCVCPIAGEPEGVCWERNKTHIILSCASKKSWANGFFSRLLFLFISRCGLKIKIDPPFLSLSLSLRIYFPPANILKVSLSLARFLKCGFIFLLFSSTQTITHTHTIILMFGYEFIHNPNIYVCVWSPSKKKYDDILCVKRRRLFLHITLCNIFLSPWDRHTLSILSPYTQKVAFIFKICCLLIFSFPLVSHKSKQEKGDKKTPNPNHASGQTTNQPVFLKAIMTHHHHLQKLTHSFIQLLRHLPL